MAPALRMTRSIKEKLPVFFISLSSSALRCVSEDVGGREFEV